MLTKFSDIPINIFNRLFFGGIMAISLKEANEMRDRTHNLDLKDSKHYKIYEDSGLQFIKHNETDRGKAVLEVYDDGKGFATIGYGFNMNAQGARGAWN